MPAFVAMLVLTCASVGFAQTQSTITVVAKGQASAISNEAELQLTVASMDNTATGLFVKQNDIVNHLKEALQNAGVDRDDISAAPLHLMPNYEYGQSGTRIISYRAETPVTVHVEHINDLPQLIDLAAKSGANMITLASFGRKNQEALHEQALTNAIQSAKAEATTLAKQAGKSLGAILSIEQIDEDAASNAPPSGGEEEEEREHKQAASQNAGNITQEHAELRVVFELK